MLATDGPTASGAVGRLTPPVLRNPMPPESITTCNRVHLTIFKTAIDYLLEKLRPFFPMLHYSNIIGVESIKTLLLIPALQLVMLVAVMEPEDDCCVSSMVSSEHGVTWHDVT